MKTPAPTELRALFDAVVELDAPARSRYLDEHCPATLRTTLEAMLAADTDTGEPGSSAHIDEISAELAMTPSLLPQAGSRIGPFEIVALLGEGGYSTVLHARRDVAGATQDVALKLLRRSLHSPEAHHQFRREQRALLSLRHPNIARMIEGGVTDAGQPFIALELVQGSDIVEYARRHALDLRARLRLFVVACRAVDAAHRALIVHRDLKPSNVLVADDGEVKLLDFGIAKLLEGDEESNPTIIPAFTPAYAAPEQRQGGAITTATDVYALGVLLGELLTGERINDGSGRTPSSRIATAARNGPAPTITRRELRGDLDTIVMKALADEPGMRYASAGTFADDVERLLDGRPVAAHPPSAWYRARKFIARHKGGVAGTLLLLLGILAALGIALWQAQVARHEAARANAQAQRAEAVRDFLVSVFDAAQPEVPREKRPGIEELVDEAGERMLADTALPPATRLDLALALARVLRSLGAKDRVHALLDRAETEAATLQLADHAEARLRTRVLRAQILLDESKPAEARAALGDAGEVLAARTDPLGVEALIARASAESGVNELDAARHTFSEARALGQRLANGGIEAERSVDIAEAAALALAQRFPDALELATATRTRWTQSGAPADPGVLQLLATISTAASVTGDVARADDAYREAITLAERIHVRPHPATAWAIGIYGSFLVSQGRYADAEPLVERALAMRRNLLGDVHPDTLNAFAALGRLRAGQLRRDDARRAFEEGIQHCRDGQVKHPVCPRLLGSLSQMLLGEGQMERAGELAARAVEDQGALSGPDSPQLVSPLQFLAQVEVRLGQYEEALRTTDRVLAIATRVGTLQSKDVRYARFRRAVALFELGRNDEALPLVRAITAEQKVKTPEEKSTLFSMLALEARALARAGQRDQARLVAVEALAIEPKPRGTDAATLADLERIAK